MTIEELAQIIGVSRVTLSKVINGAGGVAPKTEARIKEYIEKYNFEPNSSARSLVGKEEPVIGLFSAFTRSNEGAGKGITSHFGTELVNLVVDAAQERGYNTLVHLTQGSTDIRSLERILGRKLVQGAILVGYDTGNEEIAGIIARGYPLVLINQERHSTADNMAVVNMQDRDAAFTAVEKMVAGGHRNILYIGCNRSRLAAVRRREGVQEAYGKYKDGIDSLTEIDGDFNENKTYNEVRKIYQKAAGEEAAGSVKSMNLPTAIFAANDIMAIGAMNALKDLGIGVPDEVSVIGYDDIQISRYLSPALTTMRCDFSDIAEACVNTLIGMIKKEDVEREIELPSVYIERESFTSEG